MTHEHVKNAGMTYGSRTDVGMVREQNEDSILVEAPLFVVCDGMGGHAAGEVASEIAVNVIAQNAPATAECGALGAAVEQANLAVMRAAAEGVGGAGMGTTCTAAVVEGQHVALAQVGDSRAYLLHAGQLQQITRDHSLVAELVEMGEITPEQALTHPKRSTITRALGSDPNMRPDLFEINVAEGDRLLLCSDGLTTMLRDAEIARIMNANPAAQAAADTLVEAALDAGGFDNVTVCVVNLEGQRRRREQKAARKSKRNAVFVVLLLLLCAVGAGALFNTLTKDAAYLGAVDGKVAIYQGIPGSFLGLEFSELEEVSSVELSDLQGSVATRIENGDVRAESVDAARALVDEYKAEIASRSSMPGGAGSSADAAGQDSDDAQVTPSASKTASTEDGEGVTGNTQGGDA
jgi:protein phosphatase